MGEHLKKRRLDLGLRQKDVAQEVGATVQTVTNWEKGRTEPEPRHYPGIVRFLGYDPRAAPTSCLGERLRSARLRQGLTQRQLADLLDVDPVTVWAWETGRVRKPYPRLVQLFEEYVESV